MKNISCRSAAIIIKDNKILTAKNINNPCFYLVGGEIELNESSEKAIIREIFEETGLTLAIDRLAIIQERFYKANRRINHEIVFFYYMKIPFDLVIPDNSFTDQGDKETLHWLPIDKLSQYNIVPEFIKTKEFADMGIEHIISYD